MDRLRLRVAVTIHDRGTCNIQMASWSVLCCRCQVYWQRFGPGTTKEAWREYSAAPQSLKGPSANVMVVMATVRASGGIPQTSVVPWRAEQVPSPSSKGGPASPSGLPLNLPLPLPPPPPPNLTCYSARRRRW